MTNDQIFELAAKASRDLGEHVDAVEILITWQEQGQTFRAFVGNGNWYARQGMAREFIERDVASTNAVELAAKIHGIMPLRNH